MISIDKRNHFVVTDDRCFKVVGFGETEKEALENYKDSLLDYKNELLGMIENIRKIEKDIK